jgi:hypothetical protein
MSFLASDEFIILYDFPVLSGDDLRRIRDVGVQTLFNEVNWYKVESEPGVYDWSHPDALVERARKAGMKSLLRCPVCIPDGLEEPFFFPDDYYLKSSNGAIWRNCDGYGNDERHTCLSYWGPGQEEELKFLKMCQERYASPDILCFAGGPHGGEVILPGMIPTYWDTYALASFRQYAESAMASDLAEFNLINNAKFTDWASVVPADLPTYGSMQFAPTTVNWLSTSLWARLKARQDVFPEIILSLVERNIPFAEAVECGPRSGNWLMKDLCDGLPTELGKELNVILWQVNRGNSNQGALNNVRDVLDKTWIGSEYCEGLYRHTKRSIEIGLRGFITGPVRPEHNGGRLDNWHIEAIKWSLAQWKAARL